MTPRSEYTQPDLFRNSLPRHPLATDELGFLRALPVHVAITRKYIQPNRPTDLKWMVYDIDRHTATFDWYDRGVPPPNIVATNPDNGHAHLFFGLEVPVWRQYGRKDPAYRYACAIDVGLTRKLGADPGYAKLIAKNPLRPDWWIVQVLAQESYDLGGLADYLDLDFAKDIRRNLPAEGLGRNCTLFDFSRHWAYRMIRRERFLSFDLWRYECECATAGRNQGFPSPLPSTEVRSISKSVAAWVWRHMSPAGFRLWADNRRRKSLDVRRARAEETKARILAAAAANPLASQRTLAELCGVALRTVTKALKQG